MKRPMLTRKAVLFVCSYCKTKKVSDESSCQCQNCGSYSTTVLVKEIYLGKRTPFQTDNREANPL